MKRKIVRQGHSTMTVSLPASWIKKFSLKEGDEINVEESGNNLEVSASKSAGTSSIEIDATKYGLFTKNDLSHLYIQGYDEIIIHFDNEEVLKQIKERLPDCIGFEAIDQSESKITIRSISSALESEFDSILRKVFQILKNMADEILDALEKKQFDRLKQIRDMETINNKFTSFLLRLIVKKGYKVQNRSLQAYDLIQNLERIADEYKYLCDDITKESHIEKEALEILKKINSFMDLIYNLYYNFEPKKNLLIYKLRKDLKASSTKLLSKSKNSIVSSHLIALVEKIYNLAEANSALYAG